MRGGTAIPIVLHETVYLFCGGLFLIDKNRVVPVTKVRGGDENE
ncbi:hypothetical protein [Bacillus salacetis]|nr:hypothetical protein [Bacillus salacetis]